MFSLAKRGWTGEVAAAVAVAVFPFDGPAPTRKLEKAVRSRSRMVAAAVRSDDEASGAAVALQALEEYVHLCGTYADSTYLEEWSAAARALADRRPEGQVTSADESGAAALPSSYMLEMCSEAALAEVMAGCGQDMRWPTDVLELAHLGTRRASGLVTCLIEVYARQSVERDRERRPYPDPETPMIIDSLVAMCAFAGYELAWSRRPPHPTPDWDPDEAMFSHLRAAETYFEPYRQVDWMELGALIHPSMEEPSWSMPALVAIKAEVALGMRAPDAPFSPPTDDVLPIVMAEAFGLGLFLAIAPKPLGVDEDLTDVEA